MALSPGATEVLGSDAGADRGRRTARPFAAPASSVPARDAIGPGDAALGEDDGRAGATERRFAACRAHDREHAPRRRDNCAAQPLHLYSLQPESCHVTTDDTNIVVYGSDKGYPQWIDAVIP